MTDFRRFEHLPPPPSLAAASLDAAAASRRDLSAGEAGAGVVTATATIGQRKVHAPWVVASPALTTAAIEGVSRLTAAALARAAIEDHLDLRVVTELARELLEQIRPVPGYHVDVPDDGDLARV